MISIEPHICPQLARGVRLFWDDVRQQHLLLFPEGALVLNSTAWTVLELCDGQRTVSEIVVELATLHPSANVEKDVYHFLSRIAERGLLVSNEV
jgi:pyrroloquinoline quinone biosynthesis protein D